MNGIPTFSWRDYFSSTIYFCVPYYPTTTTFLLGRCHELWVGFTLFTYFELLSSSLYIICIYFFFGRDEYDDWWSRCNWDAIKFLLWLSYYSKFSLFMFLRYDVIYTYAHIFVSPHYDFLNYSKKKNRLISLLV